MSITDELRECIATAIWQYEDDVKTAYIPKDKLFAIADRIDAAHAKAVERARMDGMDETFGNGWVKLPVDADGVPIHVGDRVENNERVARIVLTDGSWEPSVYVEKLPNVLHEYFCHEVSHYQPDSWQRIIEDAAKNIYPNGAFNPCWDEVRDELVERCKRLAGEA